MLRSVGLISRNVHRWREEPAGPSLPIPAAQLPGRRSFSFAYYPSIADVLEHAERYRLPFLTAPGTADTDELRRHAGPELTGHGVVLTALRPDLVRVVNESPASVPATFGGDELELRPWEIRSAEPPLG